MFRVTPWKEYVPITEADDPPTESLPRDRHRNFLNVMEEDIDMDAPQISILQDDKTPPPSGPSSSKRQNFKVKLLFTKKPSASQAQPDDEHGEDEEDELIDDDKEVPQPTEPQPTAPPPPPVAPPKRASRSKASKTGASTSRRKPKVQPAPDTAQAGDITWCEVSQPDSEVKPSKAALDNTDTASVASTSTTKKPTKTRTRKPAAKQSKTVATVLKDEADNVSEAAFTGTAPSSPTMREASLDPLDVPGPPAIVAPTLSNQDENLEGVPCPVYPLPSKPFPVLPPVKITTGFAMNLPLDKNTTKVRHWRQAKREIRGIAGGRWFAQSWVGDKESPYATSVANNPPPTEVEKASGSVSTKLSTAGSKSSKKKEKADTAASSRSSSTVPDPPAPSRTTTGPSKMRTSHTAAAAEEEPTPAA